MVSEHQSAFDRGHVPAHEVRLVLELHLLLIQAKTCESRHCLVSFQLDFFRDQSLLHLVSHCYNDIIYPYYMSYELPKVISPFLQFSKYMLYWMSGFWLEQVLETFCEAKLIPHVICCRKTG
jgi:hypothetical protein